ncbi:MAG: single-stranded DNA-binding protein [Fluviicola sp.]|jgi:single-strand DNA-binding protein
MNTLKNKVNLIGRLGAKPVVQTFDSGSSITRISLATNERKKEKSGEWTDNTQWHNIVAWGKLGERFEKLTDKGSELVIEGRLVNRSYEKDGEKRYVTEIELTDFMLLNTKKQ